MLYRQSWLPTSSPNLPLRGVVLIVHGLAEHSDRYAELAQFLNTHQYAVYGFDLRGHGRSPGMRGYVERFEDYLVDVQTVLDQVQTQHSITPPNSITPPRTPLFLLGHSMGGAIATRFVLEHPEVNLAGLILSAPALALNPKVSPLLIRLSGLLGTLLPTMPTVALDHTGISRDPAVRAAYDQDPLIHHGKIRARTGAELIRTIRWIEAHRSALQLPLLIFHGTGDRLAPITGSEALYQAAQSTDKTFKRYEGLYHEVFNEPERAQVWQDLLDWLQCHG